MNEKEFTSLTGLGNQALKLLLDTDLSKSEYSYYKELFLSDEESFIAKTSSQAELILKLYTAFAIEAEREYIRLGIPERIYADTFSDFSIWFEAAGEKGILNSRWLMKHIKLRLFSLGRLQFEIDSENKLLHVHIPATGPLLPDEVIASLYEADSFFSNEYTLFDCSSWLLSPALKLMLDDKSNIIAFQSLFSIKSVNYESRQAEERVFGRVLDDISSYPETTTLQRKLKSYLLTGQKVGAGYGIIERKKLSSGLL